VHDIAGIGNALEIAKLALDADGVTRKTRVDGAAAGAQVLAEATPAHPGHDGRSGDSITNGAA
jgi:hypothetical protein